MNTTTADTARRDAGAQARVFSGHESFTCRYGWLPKLHEAVVTDPQLFASDERAIVGLGLGRNMVKSLRFWGDAFGVTSGAGGSVRPTDFGSRLLDPDTGLDPYLEDEASLWRLHWRLATTAGLGAWVIAFQEVADAEVGRDRLVEMVQARAFVVRGPITEGTAGAHVDILLRSYDAGRTTQGAAPEDTLGCPLQELQLLTVAVAGGRPVVRFARGGKAGLDDGAFAFALLDFWHRSAPESRSLSLRGLMLERRSPGSVLRLDEGSLHDALDRLCSRARNLVLREDGAGGMDLFATGGDQFSELEGIAWPNR